MLLCASCLSERGCNRNHVKRRNRTCAVCEEKCECYDCKPYHTAVMHAVKESTNTSFTKEEM